MCSACRNQIINSNSFPSASGIGFSSRSTWSSWMSNQSGCRFSSERTIDSARIRITMVMNRSKRKDSRGKSPVVYVKSGRLRRKCATVLVDCCPLMTPATSSVTPCSKLLNMALVNPPPAASPVSLTPAADCKNKQVNQPMKTVTETSAFASFSLPQNGAESRS